jgi:hypothetical protein
MLGWDNEVSIKQHKAVANALYSPIKGISEFRSYYERIMNDLIRQNISKLRDYYQLDAVRDATDLSHANFIANLLHIPLKARDSDGGITARDLFNKLQAIFQYVSLDVDPTKSFALRANAKKAVLDIEEIYRPVVEAVKEERFHTLKELLGMGIGTLPDYGTNFIRRLLAEGMEVDDVVWTVIPLAAEASFQGLGVCIYSRHMIFKILLHELTIVSRVLKCWTSFFRTSIKVTGPLFRNSPPTKAQRHLISFENMHSKHTDSQHQP